MERLIIGYKHAKADYFVDVITTRHSDIKILTTDLSRMIKCAPDKELKAFSDMSIYLIGAVDDDEGKLIPLNKPEFLVQFPTWIEEIKEVKE